MTKSEHTVDSEIVCASTPERLDDWSCYQVQQAKRAEHSHHIVGSICRTHDEHDERTGFVTSAIVSIDPEKRIVLTEDGTACALGRCSDMTPDAFYAWRRWQRAAQATHVVEVTADIKGVLAPAQGSTVTAPAPTAKRRKTAVL